MTAQHLIEHFEYFYLMALGKVDGEQTTPEDRVEKYQESLWNYQPMPKQFDHPLFKKGETEDLRHPSLEDARKALSNAHDEMTQFYKENPESKLLNPVFGYLGRYEMYLLERKHYLHHFEQFGLV